MGSRFALAVLVLALGVTPALAQRLTGGSSLRLRGGLASWVMLSLRNGVLRNHPSARSEGEQVRLRSNELTVQSRALDESERIFDLERDSDHLVIAGTTDTIGGALSGMNGTIAIQQLQEISRRSADRLGEDEVVSLGPSGPRYLNPLSSAEIPTTVGRRSVGAIVLYVGGAPNPRTGRYDGMAGGGYRVDLGRFSSELSIGAYGSFSQTLSLQDVLSSPGAIIGSLPTGWFTSATFCVRLFQLPLGTISLVARGQVDGDLAGSQNYMGVLSVDIRH